MVMSEEQKLDRSLLCFVCKKLVINPLHCTDCQILYCERCGYENPERTCQKCKSKKLSNKIPPSQMVTLSKYNIYCKSKNSGCQLILFYENLLEHQEHCHHERLLCIFPQCYERIKRKHFPYHIKNCAFRLIKCKFCYKDFNYRELRVHSVNCLEKLVKCQGCQKQILNKYLAEHIKNCDNLKLICQRCNKEFSREDVGQHTELNCIVGLIVKYREQFDKEFLEIKEEFEKIAKLIEQKEKYLELKCRECDKFSCEVALKNCKICRLKICSYCVKNSFVVCVNCGQDYCRKCFELSSENDVCFSCSNQNKELSHSPVIVKKKEANRITI